MSGECPLHQAAVLAVFPGPSGVESDPESLLTYSGPVECPPDEKCAGICDLARKYRRSSRAIRMNQPIAVGEFPADLWRRLYELVSMTSLQSYQ